MQEKLSSLQMDEVLENRKELLILIAIDINFTLFTK